MSTGHRALRVSFDGWTRIVPLDRTLRFGRDDSCDVRLHDPVLSRQHAEIRPTPEGAEVEDLGSRGGTFLGGERIVGPRALGVGDRVQIGPLTVEVAADALPEDPLLGVVVDLFASPDLPTLLVTVVDRALELLHADRGALLVRAEGGLETSVARDAAGRDLSTDLVLASSMARRALESGETVAVTDFGAGEDASASVLDQGLCAVVCVPLPGPGRASGVLYVDAEHAVADFGPARIALLQLLATHASLAIERARLREDAARLDAERRRTLEVENADLRSRLTVEAPLGSSPPMRRATELVRQLAPSDVTVCLTGETGTGKEVLARWLHATSPRARRPFVAVDCGAIPEGLIESELFGHVRGAFTGAASARPGHFREAEGGTLFLDEIGELPLAMQTRLLRVLQDLTVQPVGATGRVPVDVRVVCATHRDLDQAVRDGRFRQDLFYRLAVVRIELPPLRERGDDVLLLAHRFLDDLARRQRRPFEGFTADARAALAAAPWPGNVRELQHCVHRAVVLGRPPWITLDDLGLREAPPTAAPAASPAATGPVRPLIAARAESTARFEREYVEAVLARTAGNMNAAAELAGVTRQAIHRLVVMHGIDRKRFRFGPPDGG